MKHLLLWHPVLKRVGEVGGGGGGEACHRTNKYGVHSGTRQGLDLVLGHQDRARIPAWVLEKIVCSH